MTRQSPLDELLDELANRVAARVAELQTPVTDYCDQRSCGIDRKAYVKAARAGEFPASKVGRLYVARRADVTAWLLSKQSPRTPVGNTDLDDIRRTIGLRTKGAA